MNDKAHNTAAGLSKDGKTMVFARQLEGGKSNLYISYRNQDGKTFSAPVLLKTVNTEFNEIEPSITDDGQFLLFASDRPDGNGGYDIWSSPKTDGGWGTPLSLGPRVNSEFNERSPVMNPARDKLFISSDRPTFETSPGERRRFWQAIFDGREPSDYEFFIIDNMSLSRHANPLRDRKYRQSIIESLGGTAQTERAVQQALEWMKRNQERDGHWSMKKHGGGSSHDVGGTSMAILAFYGWGARHDEPGPYQATLKKALGWLVLQGKKYRGDYSRHASQGMYDHGMATIALAEAYSITRDRQLLAPLKASVKVIVDSQNRKHGGWRYTTKSRDGDTSVFGWQMMALHCASVAGIDIPEKTFDRAQLWLDIAGGGEHKGLYGYTGPSPKDAMVAEGMFVQQLLGAKPSDPRQIESASYLVTGIKSGRRKSQGSLPTSDSKTNMYYWYYGFLSLYQHQSPMWKTWNLRVRQLLVDRQVKKGPSAGTWNPGSWKEAGKLVSTAMGALSLEVYYRYLPMYKIDGATTTVLVRTIDKDLKTVWKPKAMRTTPSVFLSVPLQGRHIKMLGSPGDEHSLTFAAQGQYSYVYFASDRVDGSGADDIYRSMIVDGTFQPPEQVGDPVNTFASESAPVLCDNGFEMIFSSDRDLHGRSGWFLYRTTLTPLSKVQKNLAFLDNIKWWIIGLFAGIVTLIGMLLWWLQAENRQMVGLLMRCIMGSAALHAIVLVMLSLWMITAAIVESAGDPMEIAIDADALASEKLSLDIREKVTELNVTPEPVRIEARRDPTDFPKIIQQETALSARVPSKFELTETPLPIQTKESPTRETQAHENPDVTMLDPISLTVDVQLEEAPKPVEKTETHEAQAKFVEVTSEAPTMTESSDEALPKPTDPVSAEPVEPVETAMKTTDVKIDPQPNDSSDVPKPDVAMFESVSIDTDVELEHAPDPSARTAKTSAPAAEGQFAMASGAPAMTATADEAVAKSAAPAGATSVEVDDPALKVVDAQIDAVKGDHSDVPAPDVSMLDSVKLDADVKLDAAPSPASRTAKTSGPDVKGQFAMASGTPAMTSSTGGEAVVKSTAPAGQPTAEVADTSFKAVDAKVDALKGDHSDVSKPSLASMPMPAIGVDNPGIEQRPEGAKQAKSGVPSPEGSVTLASGAPVMSDVVGQPLGQPSSPAKAAFQKSTGDSESNVVPVYAETGPASDGAPPMVGPGEFISQKSPLLNIADAVDLAAPVDRKTNYPLRNPLKRNRVLKRLGGNDKTEKAIRLSLDWFTKHQEADGSWDSAKYNGAKGHNNAATGFAMLCYFGWGARHTEEGPYQVPMSKAVKWLASRVDEKGDLTGGASQGMYDQGIATMALAEAYGMTRDPALLEPLRRAVNFIIGAQNREGGWRYRYDSQDSDTSVVGWQVMALTSARMAGLR
ncbi:MAG: hypothetical protein HN350_11355, partial [Phycisphaerales bacterium]|nr:hypothetical protein [Phycisphaerales bacterium]